MKSLLIKSMASVIGISVLLVIIVPILVYEDISDRRWKKEKSNGI
jgi:hypothetical protein